jgi:hypothetical protein
MFFLTTINSGWWFQVPAMHLELGMADFTTTFFGANG